jgi:hypothetical protein
MGVLANAMQKCVKFWASRRLYQKCHINKVMAVAFVGMKGNACLLDCNVTGSDEGTSNSAKFLLMALFCDQVFPKIGDLLVGPGGAYNGYLPVFQCNNAGPNVDGSFHYFMKGICESKGWKWEPCTAQMPHNNNLDLAVFQMMSKRHSALLKMYSNLQASHKIWRTAEEVWTSLGLPRLLADTSWHIALLQRSLRVEVRKHSFKSRTFIQVFVHTSLILAKKKTVVVK